MPPRRPPLTTQTTIGLLSFGPYLHSEPKNPLADDPSSISDSTDPVAYTNIAAFYYDYDGGAGTGRFIASYEPQP